MKENREGFVREIALADLAATKTLGARIAAHLKPGDTIALEGDLGAGKTELARGILESLGVTESVPSPTFTLVQHYDTPRLAVDHFDLYRIEAESELDQLGLDEALSSGAALIEWPDRAGNWLPPDALHVKLDVLGEKSRRARIRGPAAWSAAFGE
jgi:tRNA threonylcarbamoyl adenosine modification protein YjeE